MITIKDVALKAGVSISTVSHVINNTRYVKADTSVKVLNAIKELNYFQNTQARSLVTGKSKIIGLVVSDITNPFFPELIQGVEKSAIQDGFDIFLFNTNYDSERTAIITRRLIEQKVDGVIIMTTEIEYNLVELLTSNGIPVVLLDWGITDQLVSNIKEDFTVGIEEAIKHLVELGHKEIAFISGPLKLKTAITRKDAFIEAMYKYRDVINELLIYEGDFKIEGGEAAVDEMMRNSKLPTAILASNDLMAIGAIKAIKKRGYKVPQDISVIGLDDIFIASNLEPSLTTVNLPRYKIGKTSWKLIRDHVVNNIKDGKEVVIETKLIIRETTSIVKSYSTNNEVVGGDQNNKFYSDWCKKEY